MSESAKWFAHQPRRPEAKMRLICLAWAGGNSTVFARWNKRFDSSIEIVSLQLPGRMSRLREDCIVDLYKLVEKVAEMLNAGGYLSGPPPFALFGHSFGAVCAYELAKVLQERYGATPVHIFVSGRHAPHLPSEPRTVNVSALPREELVDHLVELGGMPAELRDQKDILDVFIPAIRADYACLEEYVWNGSKPDLPEDVPVTVLQGTEDAAFGEKSEAWAELARGPFDLQTFEGGHFFVKSAEEAVLAHVNEVLMAKIST